MSQPTRQELDKHDIEKMTRAAKYGDFETALGIIRKKVYLINCIPDGRRWSVLHQAVYWDNCEVIKKLIAYPNCDINIRAKEDRCSKKRNGKTPVELAKDRKSNCLQLLQEKLDLKEETFLVLENDSLPESAIYYYQIAASYLDPKKLQPLDIEYTDLVEMCKKINQLLEADWKYAQQRIADCLRPFDYNAAIEILKAINLDSLKRKIVEIYTGNNIYRMVNAALRESHANRPVNDCLYLAAYTLFLQIILLFWNSIPPSTATSYRGTTLSKEQARQYKIGTKFAWMPFTSSSLEEKVSFYFMDNGKKAVKASFVIDNGQSSWWRPSKVAHLSEYDEKELLYPSGATFEVTDIKEWELEGYGFDFMEYHIKLLQ